MHDKLFLGVADNNQYSVAVVGDSTGRIVATSVGESVNYEFCGVSQARENLKILTTRALGNRDPRSLERVCFTYKGDAISNDWEAARIIHGVLETREVRLENFGRSCTLGMNTKKDRMFLVGSESSFVVFQDVAGMRFKIREDPEISNLRKCLERKLQLCPYLFIQQELHRLEEIKQMNSLISAIEQLAHSGDTLALEIIHEMAHILVNLVIKTSRQFQSFEPVIALYGQVFYGSRLVYERVCYLIKILYPQAQILEGTLIPAKGAYFSSLVGREVSCNPEIAVSLNGNLE